MLKRLRKAHPILFCVLAEVVFLASLFVTDLVFTIALVLFRTDFASIDTYLYSTLQELVGAMVAVLFLVRTDRAGLLRRRGSAFQWPAGGHVPAGVHWLQCLWVAGAGPAGERRAAACGTHLHLPCQHGHGGCGRGIHLPRCHCPDPAGALWHQPRRCVEGLPFVRCAVWCGAPDQYPQFGTLRCADAVRVCSIAWHSFCGDLLPHRQFVGDGIPAWCHGYFVHAHRWAVRHHYRGRCGERLRCIHAAFGAAVSDPHRSSAAQKEAAGGTAVLAPVRKK